jgi:hypothetical protein
VQGSALFIINSAQVAESNFYFALKIFSLAFTHFANISNLSEPFPNNSLLSFKLTIS